MGFWFPRNEEVTTRFRYALSRVLKPAAIEALDKRA